MLLNNEIALVTGASRGIGAGIALALGEQGATVVGTATGVEGADAISATLEKNGIKGCGIQLDVNDAERVSQISGEISDRFGPVSVLVNNAGITRDNLLLRMKDGEWDDIIATNLTSVFRLSKVCMKGMVKARRGRIINIASVVGATGNPGQTNYAASKAGVIGFTKSLARELGARGITVNAIAPGFITSDMTDALSEEQKQALIGTISLGRLGTAQEIGQSAVFLASPMADYITGQTLHVNGGMHMN